MNFKELRKYPRAKVDIDISFTDVKADERMIVRGSSVDISVGGLFVKSSLFIFKAGTILSLSFVLPTQEKKIQVKGRVSNFAVINNRPGMGIEFIDIKEEDKKLIDEFVKNQA